jgi:deoxyadenosine/deoxycytidine kinase
MGNMEPQEMEVYKSVCRERLPASLAEKVDMVMYLDVEPTECHRRMNALRQREAEEGVPLSYLEGVDSCYFHLLVNWLAQRYGPLLQSPASYA